MPGRQVTNPSPSVVSVPQLPAFERLAPSAPSEEIVSRILAWTRPGDAVLDVDGRGAWVARAAIAEQRRAIDLESGPLTRLLAEVVLRPPDIRQIDSAANAIAATRLGGSTVRKTIDAMFAGTCPGCGRPVTIDAMVWEPMSVGVAVASGRSSARAVQADARTRATVSGEGEVEGGAPKSAGRRAPKARTKASAAAELPLYRFTPDESLRPIGIEYPCERCRQQLGGEETRHADAVEGDVALAQSFHSSGPTREAMRTRFPAPRPTHPLVDEIIDLHTPRQLAGLYAILRCIEGEERVAAVTPALRLALLHAVLLASRLNVHDRPAPIAIVNGALHLPATHAWRERNPWLAFEDGLKIVKAFVQRVEVGEPRSAFARLAIEIGALENGTANTILGESTTDALRKLAVHGERKRLSLAARAAQSPESTAQIRLMIGQPALLWNAERLAAAYHATGWLFGAAATDGLPYERLFAVEGRPAAAPRAEDEAVDQARAIGRSLAVAAPALAPDGRAVMLLDDATPATLIAAALGGAAAGCRLVEARLRSGGEGSNGIVVYVPPTGVVNPGPRTRANRPLPPVVGGAGDPGTVSGTGLLAPPERLDEGPFRPSVALQVISDTAVELLKARGEPATYEQLLGELLLGLDRCGQLARLARCLRPAVSCDDEASPGRGTGASAGAATGSPEDDLGDEGERRHRANVDPHTTPTWEDWLNADPRIGDGPTSRPQPQPRSGRGGRGAADDEPPPGPVELLLNLIREELDRPNNRRICQIEPGRYWLASHDDQSKAQQPLADRVEWAVFSLLSSAKELSRRGALERTLAMFKGGDSPDGALVETCLESYAARSSTPDEVVAFDDLETRAIEHDAIIARLADLGHRLGMRVWIGRRQQGHRIRGMPLSTWLDDEERDVHLPLIAWAPEGELERVDCAWYVRRRMTFLFEVEWTAMLGEPVLVHHARYSADDKVVRFLVLPPERARLAAYKIEQSPLLRKAIAERNWHFLKWNHLMEFSEAEEPTLEALEPYLGLQAPADRAGEQLGMFGG